MTRSQKRDAIRAELQENPTRSNRAIGAMIGCDDKTVAAARTEFRTAEIEIPHSGRTAEIAAPGAEIDPAGAGLTTPAAVADWLIKTFGRDGVARIIKAVARRALSPGAESELAIAWEAGQAARDLCRLWSTARLDEFREALRAGQPDSEPAPRKRITIPDDPAKAAAKLWLFWGTTPSKLARLSTEIASRTHATLAPPPPPPPGVEDPDFPF